MLTREQQKLVEENHNFIYYVIHKYSLPLEEYYDLLAISLCKAAKIYDPNLGCAFTSLAGQIMKNDILVVWRHDASSLRVPRSRIVSLDAQVYHKETGKRNYFEDYLARFMSTDLDRSEIEIEEFLDTLDDRQRHILQRFMDGYTGREIAQELGITFQRVGQLKKVLRDRWNDYAA